MAWASGKVSARALLRNWVIVYLGTLSARSELRCWYSSGAVHVGGNAIGITALRTGIANPSWTSCSGGPGRIVQCPGVHGHLAHVQRRSTIDKILAIVFPIAAFVAAGFEHSVANMYFIHTPC